MYAFLADLIVIFHFCYVTFTVGGEIVVLVGGALGWRWVRNLAFRVTHLAAVVLVAVEALAGAACPLTVWEYQLRVLAGQRVEQQIGFVARLVRSIIFYDFPAWVFVLVYAAFALLVAASFFIVRPGRRPPRRRRP